VTTFLEMHVPGSPLLMPNPWDVGSARILASLGFRALGTTSNGQAASLGRPDGSLIPDEVLAHARRLVQTVDVPISVDLEDGFANEPAGVRAVVFQAARTGIAGCSIEDWSADGIRPLPEAVERMEAAVSAAEGRVVLTGRAENFFRGNPDLDDTITRLQAYQEAGADVLYAPGVREIDGIRAICEAVTKPVNVFSMGLGRDQIFAAGAQRISTAGGLTYAAANAVIDAAERIRDEGDFSGLGLPNRVTELGA
jgi:2-methylisocitrate lyase-like PEP mutase family enzyme